MTLQAENSTIQLSVIIVNYNVKYFLEQCLASVAQASRDVKVEVFVVDNNSIDGSVDLVRSKYPNVKLIENKDNVGFSKANNQAIEEASGKYILLLNPDTVVEEDTFLKVFSFMEDNEGAGALGVKMIDGKGNFLPESKRGLPTPWVAFYKIIGLSKLFPKSKKFGNYHLGYLDENKAHSVDVLSGAFMLLRKSVLDKVGLLDETFFMYGEDIDLSYRVTQAGYKNYYFPETTIIHYKGESTKKQSINYVRIFYKAMAIFANKHFSSNQAGVFSFLINIAIYLKALLTLLANLAKSILVPAIDATIIYLGLFAIKSFWESNIKADEGITYPETYLAFNVPMYILIWLLSILFSGGYDKPIKLVKILRGVVLGMLVIAAVYGFLPEEYRFSRGMIVIGGLWAMVGITAFRYFMNALSVKGYELNKKNNRRLVVVGSKQESERVSKLVEQSGISLKYVGHISTEDANDSEALGELNQLKQIVNNNNVNEVIFCSKDIVASDIISWMTTLGTKMDYKIVHPDSEGIVGSNSKNSAGDLYTFEINFNITLAKHKRNKRLFDFMFSMLLFPIIVLSILFKGSSWIQKWWKVWIGNYTWVGYNDRKDKYVINLPPIKKGVFHCVGESNEEQVRQANLNYAKNYNVIFDVKAIWSRGFR